MRKMTSVTERTSRERPKAVWAGVPAGSKMFVGDCAEAVPIIKDKLQTVLHQIRAEPKLALPMSAGERLVKRDTAVGPLYATG
jgi:hypothetical protein